MTRYNPGDILLLVKFPQTDLKKEVKRPALVLADMNDDDVIVARITSELTQREHDCLIKSWQSAGLLLPSVARIGKVATLHKRFVSRKLGSLSQEDFQSAKEIVKKVFNV